MDKQRMEMILPARKNIANNRKKEEPEIILTDLVQVNAIVDKRNSSKKKLHPIRPILKSKSVKYENQKQEQFYRLNRENKIRQNNEWTELIKQSNESIHDKQSIPALKPQMCLKKLKETNKQIDEATVQLEQISAFIQAKKNQLEQNSKGSSTTVSTTNSKMNTSKSGGANTYSNVKHLCTKNIYDEKMRNVDSMINFIGKHMELENKLESRQKTVSQREKNNLQRKKLDDTLSLVSSKLNKVKDKYFTNDYETNHITSVINKRPKYRSVKDLMKADSSKLSSMEATKIIQADLEKDINNLSENSEILHPPKNNQIQVLFEHVDSIQKGSFQDDFDDEFRKEYNKSQMAAPKLIHKGSRRYTNSTSRALTPVKEERGILGKSIAVDTQTPIPNKLEQSIMRSDYLMKEFGIDTSHKYSLPAMDGKVQVSNGPKRWTKDLEYFMT